MNYRVTDTGWHSVLATSAASSNSFGSYIIELSCNDSGCLFPMLVEPLPNLFIAPIGQPVTIGFDVNHIGGFTAALIGNDITPVATSNTNMIVTPPAGLTPQRYLLRVENECGSDDSNSFLVMAKSNKNRAVRH